MYSVNLKMIPTTGTTCATERVSWSACLATRTPVPTALSVTLSGMVLGMAT